MEPTKPGYREFVATRDDKTTVRLSVRKPNRKELDYSDLEYSAKFNHSICHGIPTQTKLLRTLRENEIIDPATEAKIAQLATDATALEKQIAKDRFTSPEAKQEAEQKLTDLQRQVQELNGEIDSYFEHTAETKSAQAQRNFLIACVIEVRDGERAGKRLWGSVDELLSEEDSSLIQRTLYEYMMCARGMPSEWDRLIAEQKEAASKADKEEEEADAKDKAAPQVAEAVAAAAPVVVMEEAHDQPERTESSNRPQPVG